MKRLAIVIAALTIYVWPVLAETRALVVGIDNYGPPIRTLLGAVNDANDVAKALTEIRVTDVELLEEASATRNNVIDAWNGLLARASRGDTILVHFAGHGAQYKDVEPIDEADQSDEVFLLSGFNEDESFNEKLSDDEIYEWGQAAGAKGVNAVFILDTCHSGGLARAVDFRLTKGSSRITEFKTHPKKSQGPLSIDMKPLEFGSNIVLITATGESQKVEESFRNGQFRGILSEVFARGLRGAADLDHDGKLTSVELIRYVEPLVRSESNNAQDPQSFLPENPIVVATGLTKEKLDDAKTDFELPIITVNVRGEQTVEGNWNGATIEPDESKADLTWDPEAGIVISAQGDALAWQSDAPGFQHSIDAMRVARGFGELMKGGNVLSVLLSGGYGIYCEGTEFQITSSKSTYRYYTAIDLTGGGDAQFQYPSPDLKSHQLEWDHPYPWSYMAKVGKPYGSDLILLIASEKPLLNLHGAFKAEKNRTLPALKLFELLLPELASTKYEAGMVRIFTQEMTAEDGTKCAAK